MLDKTGLFSIGHREAFSFDFEVQIAIQQAVSKVAMSGAYIREVYTIYCIHPKNPPDPVGKPAEACARRTLGWHVVTCPLRVTWRTTGGQTSPRSARENMNIFFFFACTEACIRCIAITPLELARCIRFRRWFCGGFPSHMMGICV